MSLEPIRRSDFIILSTQDWDSLPTRKHRFARRWAESGNSVLYTEQQIQGPRSVEMNLWVFTLPIVLPFFQMSGLINGINNLFLLSLLRLQLRRFERVCSSLQQVLE
jgi:hypothetical protein